MMLTLDNAEKILRENNLLGNENVYIIGTVMPGIMAQTFMGPLISGVKVTNYIISKNEENLIFIPCNKLNNEPMLDKKVIIPSTNITKIIVKKGNPGHIKADLMSNEKVFLSIQVGAIFFKNRIFKDNYILFINTFENEGLELLSKKNINKSALKNNVFASIAIIIMIFGVIKLFQEGSYIIGIILSAFIVLIIYGLIKSTKLK